MDKREKWPEPKNGDRVTMRRGKNEVVKIIVSTGFYPEASPRSDLSHIETLHALGGWRVTRVEPDYQAESDPRSWGEVYD